jgi:hypothetical protein
MLRISLLIAVVFFVGLSCEVYAQDAGSRATELAAALDKNKYKKKEKANISIEIYIDIKNEPAVREDPSAYSGRYDAGDYQLNLNVGRDGSATGEGYDTIGVDARRVSFTLSDARVQGALLTGTKNYNGGQSEKFEAVFANRTVSTGKNANQIESRDTMFGLGFLQAGNSKGAESWTNRVFLEKR